MGNGKSLIGSPSMTGRNLAIEAREKLPQGKVGMKSENRDLSKTQDEDTGAESLINPLNFKAIPIVILAIIRREFQIIDFRALGTFGGGHRLRDRRGTGLGDFF